MTMAPSLALVDCPTGLAGNMLLAALFDLGLPEAAVAQPLSALGLGEAYRLERSETRSAGLRGLRLEVALTEPSPPHRHWGELHQLIAVAPLDPALKGRVLAVFGLLADAEAAVRSVAATPDEPPRLPHPGLLLQAQPVPRVLPARVVPYRP